MIVPGPHDDVFNYLFWNYRLARNRREHYKDGSRTFNSALPNPNILHNYSALSKQEMDNVDIQQLTTLQILLRLHQFINTIIFTCHSA